MRNAPIVARCLLAAAVVGLPAITAASCASTPTVEVQLEDPHNLRDSATFAQLVVFEGGCPDKSDLAEGKIEGYRWMQSTDASSGFGEIGTLEKAEFGFAALLRNENCGVMGFGCTPVNLDHHRNITVAVNEVVTPARGECESGQTCDNSKCVESASDAGPDVQDAQPDTGPLTCDLNVIATADFDNPPNTGYLYGGAAVVPTPTGFVVMYHEVDPGGETPRLIRLKISDQGQETTRTDEDLSPCTETIEFNGMGAAWNDTLGAGMVAVSRPPCATGDKARLHVSNFNEEGETTAHAEHPPPSSIMLNSVKSVAASPTDERFLLAGMLGSSPYLYVFTGISVQSDPPPSEIHPGNGTITFAQIATAPNVRATLTDSDVGGSKLVMMVNDLGSGTSSTTSLPYTAVTSLTVWDDRVALIQPSASSLAWTAIEKSGDSIADGTVAGGPYTAMDVTQLHDYLLIAAGKAGSITVFRLDDANGTFSDTSTTQQDLDSDAASLSQYLGDQVAITAARGRVVVAWTTSKAPLTSTGTAPGGYAVLGCDG